jgi:hypothetical protein
MKPNATTTAQNFKAFDSLLRMGEGQSTVA